MSKSEIFGLLVLLVATATVLVCLWRYEPKKDEWGSPLDSWEAEQRRRRASVYGYETCPSCGNASMLDGKCHVCTTRDLAES